MSDSSQEPTEDELKDRLADYEVTEEQREAANEIASGGGSGSVVVKPQLCGKYCSGCPHGPYAWLVNGEGWTYLGKVGGDRSSDSSQDTGESEEQQDEDAGQVPDYVDENLQTLADALGDVKMAEKDGTWFMQGSIDDPDKLAGDVDEIGVTVSKNIDSGAIKVDIGAEGRGKSWTVSDYSEVALVTDIVSDVHQGDALMYWDLRNAGVQYDVGGETVDVDVKGRTRPMAEVTSGQWMNGKPDSIESKESLDAYLTAQENYSEYGSESDIAAVTSKDTQYGTKVGITSPYDAKDDINDLDFDAHHQKWNSNLDMWFVDADSVGDVADKLQRDGWNVNTGGF